MSPRDRWRALVMMLAGESTSPRRTAAGFAIGVFLSFSPLLGLQIAIGAAAAFAFRLSRAAVFLGLCTNLPAIMIPWYLLTTAAGAAMLGVPIRPGFGPTLSGLMDLPVYRAAFWQRAADIVGPMLWSFLLGTTLGAAVAGALAYIVALRVLARLQRSER